MPLGQLRLPLVTTRHSSLTTNGPWPMRHSGQVSQGSQALPASSDGRRVWRFCDCLRTPLQPHGSVIILHNRSIMNHPSLSVRSKLRAEGGPQKAARRSRTSRLLHQVGFSKATPFALACPNPSGFRRLVGSTHDTRPLVRKNKMHSSRFNRSRNQNRCPCTGGRPITSHSTPGNISIRPAGFGNSRDW